MGDEWETSVILMRPKTLRVGDKCGRQVGDKCKLMRPKAAECEGQVGDKCKLIRPKAPRVGDKCGRQVGDKCKIMPFQDTQSGRQVWETSDKWKTSVSSCSPRHPKCEGQVWETSVNSCGSKTPKVGDKWESSGRQVQTHAAQGTQSGRKVQTHAAQATQSERQVWGTSGRQV